MKKDVMLHEEFDNCWTITKPYYTQIITNPQIFKPDLTAKCEPIEISKHEPKDPQIEINYVQSQLAWYELYLKNNKADGRILKEIFELKKLLNKLTN